MGNVKASSFGSVWLVGVWMLLFVFSRHGGALTIQSKQTGGVWSDPATWVEQRVPGADDSVQIAGGVSFAQSITVAELRILASGSLRPVHSMYSSKLNITVKGDMVNDGKLREDYPWDVVRVSVGGSAINNGEWMVSYTGLTANARITVGGRNPFRSRTVEFTGSMELAGDPVIDGGLHLSSKQIRFIDPRQTIRASGDFYASGTEFVNGGSVVLTCTNQRIVDVTMSIPSLILAGPGDVRIGKLCLTGNLVIDSGVNVAGDRLSVDVYGLIHNRGTVMSSPEDSAAHFSCSGDIVNAGIWNRSRITLNGAETQGIYFAAENPVCAAVEFMTFFTGSVFQWYKDDGAISGGLATVFGFDTLTVADYGRYHCRIGQFTSRNLIIAAAPDSTGNRDRGARQSTTGRGPIATPYPDPAGRFTANGRRCGGPGAAAGILVAPARATVDLRCSRNRR